METFSLSKLPLLPVKLAIELMEVEDQIKIAMTSNKLEEFIKLIKYYVANFEINLSNDKPFFVIRRDYYKNNCDVLFNRIDGEVFDTKNFINWYKDHSNQGIDLKSINPIGDAMNVSKRLRQFFKIRFLHWKLNLDELNPNEIMEVLPIIISENCHFVTIFNGNIDSNLLTYVLNTLKPEISLSVDSEIPLNFKHEKALNFDYCHYKNGLWITVEDLFPIRDRFSIGLGVTNFSFYDLSRFLHYWINCENHMMQSLYLRLRKDAVDDINVLLHRFVLYKNDDITPTYFILSQNDQKTRKIGRLMFLKDEIIFSTYGSTAEYISFGSTGFHGSSYVIPILKMLQRHRELMDKYAEIIEDEIKVQEQSAKTTHGSVERANVEEKLEEFKIQKESMEIEFNEIVEKLLIESVVPPAFAINSNN